MDLLGEVQGSYSLPPGTARVFCAMGRGKVCTTGQQPSFSMIVMTIDVTKFISEKVLK